MYVWTFSTLIIPSEIRIILTWVCWSVLWGRIWKMFCGLLDPHAESMISLANLCLKSQRTHAGQVNLLLLRISFVSRGFVQVNLDLNLCIYLELFCKVLWIVFYYKKKGYVARMYNNLLYMSWFIFGSCLPLPSNTLLGGGFILNSWKFTPLCIYFILQTFFMVKIKWFPTLFGYNIVAREVFKLLSLNIIHCRLIIYNDQPINICVKIHNQNVCPYCSLWNAEIEYRNLLLHWDVGGKVEVAVTVTLRYVRAVINK